MCSKTDEPQSMLTGPDDDITFTVEISDSVRSVDDAVDYFLEKSGQFDPASSVETADPVVFSGIEYRHLLVERACTSHECFITCTEGTGGNMMYVCWDIAAFKNSPLSHLLTADDPQLAEVMESLALK